MLFFFINNHRRVKTTFEFIRAEMEFERTRQCDLIVYGRANKRRCLLFYMQITWIFDRILFHSLTTMYFVDQLE